MRTICSECGFQHCSSCDDRPMRPEWDDWACLVFAFGACSFGAADFFLTLWKVFH